MSNVNSTVYENISNPKPFDDQKSQQHHDVLLITKVMDSYYKHTDNTIIRKLETYVNNSLTAIDEFYQNGKRKTGFSYNNNLKNGKQYGWYQNGILQCEVSYINDKVNGELQSWYDNGKLAYRGYYKFGSQIGKHYGWHKNGVLWSEQNFYNGKLEGRSLKWDENGVLKSMEEYRNGEIVGKEYSKNNVIDQGDYPQVIEFESS